jgi:gliding motility-associated-like protein
MKKIICILISCFVLLFGKQATAQITNYSVSVTTPTICAGTVDSVKLWGSQTYTASNVVYGLVSTANTTTIIGSAQPGTGGVLYFPASPTVTTSYYIAATIVGTQTVVMNDTVAVTITVKPSPSITVTAAPSSTFCAGSQEILSVSSGGALTYSWSTGQITSTISVNPSVTTTYSVTGTGTNGCKNKAAISIVVLPPSVAAGWTPPPICVGDTIHLRHTLGPGAIHGGTWLTSAGSLNGDSLLILPSIGTTFTVSYAVCNDTVKHTLTVHALPAITVSPPTPTVCANGSVTLTANGASTYTWAPATALSAAVGSVVTANPTATSIYTVTGTSSVGCINTATTNLAIRPKPTITSVSTPTVCSGNPATLSVTATPTNCTYTWASATGSYYADTTITYTVGSPTVTTHYTVTAQNAYGCTSSKTTTLTVYPLPGLTANSATVCAGSGDSISVYGANTYTWQPSKGLNDTVGPHVFTNPTSNITYTVTGLSGNGCSNTIHVDVTVAADNSAFCLTTIKVHNAFSPNGDGLNDVFTIDNITDYPENHVYIFNRWGQLLWNEAGYNNTNVAWYGKDSDGKALYAGTYYYIIENVGTGKPAKGWVELTNSTK